jgi:hypothetical protein
VSKSNINPLDFVKPSIVLVCVALNSLIARNIQSSSRNITVVHLVTDILWPEVSWSNPPSLFSDFNTIGVRSGIRCNGYFVNSIYAKKKKVIVELKNSTHPKTHKLFIFRNGLQSGQNLKVVCGLWLVFKKIHSISSKIILKNYWFLSAFWSLFPIVEGRLTDFFFSIESINFNKKNPIMKPILTHYYTREIPVCTSHKSHPGFVWSSQGTTPSVNRNSSFSQQLNLFLIHSECYIFNIHH